MSGIRIYGIDLKDMTLEQLLKHCYHTEECDAEKGVYNRGDTLVGTIHNNGDYLIYSCGRCGGLYIVEGKVPISVEKGL